MSMSSRWKSEWKSACPLFVLNRRVHLAALIFSASRSACSQGYAFPCGSILCGHKLCVVWEGKLSLFKNEFVLFCISSQTQLSVHRSNSCFERVLEIFYAVGGFYINSAHESNPLFVFILLTESIAKLMYDVQHGISPKSIQALFE